ncbi:RNA-binding protein [Ilyomonas limi]|uniref:RNA-binding protein n=1 Tax=Ilyomonas limi TaxID=2575867 RepID=A0A4U3KWA5_9BACT|nr:RNA-binding protein [Ilyomonas limi]TKK66652.1 RNA-binding protein [Ilyomonas limi]
MMLFIAGLSTDFDEVDLKEMFELYGEVASARVITDRNTGKSKGFGFVDMPNKEEAKETIATLDNVVLGKKRISVKEAEPQQSRPSTGGYNSAPRSGGFNNSPRSGGYNPRGNSGGGYNNPRGGDDRGGDRGGYNRRDNDDRYNKRY